MNIKFAILAFAPAIVLASCVSENSRVEVASVVEARASSPTVSLPSCTGEAETRSVQAYCLFNSAALLFSNGYPDLAKQEFLQVLELDDSFLDAYLHLGEIYFSEMDLENAKNMYTSAIDLAPDNFQAHLNLGVVYDSIGSQDLAINSYETAINLNPESARSYFNLGAIYSRIPELHDEAVQSFEMVIQLEPDNPTALFNLGQIHEYQRRRSAALDYYRKAAALGHLEAEERISRIRNNVSESRRTSLLLRSTD